MIGGSAGCDVRTAGVALEMAGSVEAAIILVTDTPENQTELKRQVAAIDEANQTRSRVAQIAATAAAALKDKKAWEASQAAAAAESSESSEEESDAHIEEEEESAGPVDGGIFMAAAPGNDDRAGPD